MTGYRDNLDGYVLSEHDPFLSAGKQLVELGNQVVQLSSQHVAVQSLVAALLISLYPFRLAGALNTHHHHDLGIITRVPRLEPARAGRLVSWVVR